jgi:hypothetical protein
VLRLRLSPPFALLPSGNLDAASPPNDEKSLHADKNHEHRTFLYELMGERLRQSREVAANDTIMPMLNVGKTKSVRGCGCMLETGPTRITLSISP